MSRFLLESGDYLLLESGDRLILESSVDPLVATHSLQGSASIGVGISASPLSLTFALSASAPAAVQVAAPELVANLGLLGQVGIGGLPAINNPSFCTLPRLN